MGDFLKSIYKKSGIGIDRKVNLDSLKLATPFLESIIESDIFLKVGCNLCDSNGYFFNNKSDGSFGKVVSICNCAINANNYNKAYSFWKNSNIPKKLIMRYKFSIWDSSGINFDRIINIMKEKDEKSWIYIHGNAGTGKTYLAILIAKMCLLKEYSVFYIKTVDLLDRLRPNGGEDSNKLMNKCKDVNVLILDDIGHEKMSEWVRERMFSLISSRWDNGLLTVFTSNFDIENIKDKINEAVYSRIKGESYEILINGKDKRLN